VEDELKDCMNGTLVEYYADEKMKNSWDKIQIEVYILSCMTLNDKTLLLYTQGLDMRYSAI
jgi:hypothetical protein